MSSNNTTPNNNNNGWIKAKDPKTGRTFYANKITRETQWEKPPGFIEQNNSVHSDSATRANSLSSNTKSTANTTKNKDDDEPLPENWEKMYDPVTGKAFYIDHVNKKTTWERPKVSTPRQSSINEDSTGSVNQSNQNTSVLYPNKSKLLSNVKSTYSKTPSYYKYNQTTSKSYSLPSLDFSILQIPDAARQSCPSCQSSFSSYRRRHHCRLCGDVFCDTCSNIRVLLPLDGEEYANPVRVCTLCHKDVERENYFSLRRYIPPLELYNSAKSVNQFASEEQVCQALSSLGNDLENYLESSMSIEDKLTIPPNVFIAALGKYLVTTSNFGTKDTFDYSLRVLSVLFSITSLIGDNTYIVEVYHYENGSIISNLLSFLERGQNTRDVNRNIFLQEHAAKILYTLTSSSVLTKLNDEERNYLDLQRVFTAMLDYVTSDSILVQRWCTACIHNLLYEDHYRNKEGSIFSKLIPSGCIFILCSLLCSEDNDTRIHAISALVTIMEYTNEKGGREEMISAILSGGGCSRSSLSLLLLSSEDEIALLGCSFIYAMLSPVLIKHHPTEDLYKNVVGTLSNEADVLPIFLQYFRSGQRSFKLKVLSLKILACMTMVCSGAKDDELRMMVPKLEAEGVMEVTLSLIQMNKTQLSFQITDEVQLVELAGIVLQSTLVCILRDATTKKEFQKHCFLTILALVYTEESMMLPSSLEERMDWCFRYQPFLEILVSIYPHGISNDDERNAADFYLESMDNGLLSFIAHFLSSESDTNEMKVGEIKKQIACLRIISMIFSFVYKTQNIFCSNRFLSAITALESSDAKFLTNIVWTLPQSVATLQTQNSLDEALLYEYTLTSLETIGSICGSSRILQVSTEAMEERIQAQLQKLCQSTYEYLFQDSSRYIVPTMLVGGYGEAFIQPALVLSAALVSHSSLCGKLAYAGILVPTCDMLRQSSLDRTSMYASLVVLRYCGPCVKMEDVRGGGSIELLQAIRDVIPFVANLLESNGESMDFIKRTCIRSLYDLSTNSSFWGIMAQSLFLPFCTYLDTIILNMDDNDGGDTLHLLLCTMDRILQLPSHVITAYRSSNIIMILSRFLLGTSESSKKDAIAKVINILHTFSQHREIRSGEYSDGTNLVYSGIVQALCSTFPLLDEENTQEQVLDILLLLLSDMDKDAMQAFVESVLAQSNFLTRLFATLITVHLTDEELEEAIDYTKSYGKPYSSSLSSSKICSLLCYITLLCSIAPDENDTFWNLFFATSVEDAKDGCIVTSYLLLTLLLKEENIKTFSMDQDFFQSSRISVLIQLFNGLTHKLLPGQNYDTKTLQKYPISTMAVELFHVHEELIPPLCEFLQVMIMTQEDVILPSLIASKTTLNEIFDLLSYSAQDTKQVIHVRTFICHVIRLLAEGPYPLLEKIGEYHLLPDAIMQLSQVCDVLDDIEDMDYFDAKSHTYTSIFRDCIFCLVVLLSHRSNTSSETEKPDKMLIEDSKEALTLSTKLGALLSNMILTQFASAVEEDFGDDEKKSDIKELVSHTSEAILLCHLADHTSSLPILVKCGGLEALHLLITEGLLLPLTVFRKACAEYPEEVIQMDGHRSLMEVLIINQACDQDITSIGLECLYILCDKSSNGRKCICSSDLCVEILTLASNVIPSCDKKKLDSTTFVKSEDIQNSNNDDATTNVFPTEVLENPAGQEEPIDAIDLTRKDDSNDVLSNYATEPTTEQKEPVVAIIPTDPKNDTLEPSSEKQQLTTTAGSTKRDNFTTDQTTSKKLMLAAISFLTQLISDKHCFKTMNEQDLFSKLVGIIDVDNPYKDDISVKHAVIRFLSCHALLPYDYDTSASTTNLLIPLFCQILHGKKLDKNDAVQSKNSTHVNILSHISTALHNLFYDLTSEMKVQVLSDLSQCFLSIVNSLENGSLLLIEDGLLTYNISSLFVSLQLCQESQIQKVLYDSELVASFIALIQTLSGDTTNDCSKTDLYWAATLTQTLQCLCGCLQFHRRRDGYEKFVFNILNGSNNNIDTASNFVQILKLICNDDGNPLNAVTSKKLIRLIL